jgi:type II secretory pathway component GspD/PulD (secretin)
MVKALLAAWCLTSVAQNANPPAQAVPAAAGPSDKPAIEAVQPPSAPAAQEIVPPPSTPEGQEVMPSIIIEEANLTDAIKTLARQARLNVMFDPKIAGVGPDGKPLPQPVVSFRFENVTAQNALEALLNNYGLVITYDKRTKIARVTTRDVMAEPRITRIIQLKYASPSNMVEVLKPTLSQGSRAIGDSRTSQLVVMATAKEMETVDELVAQLDTATKQVLIEANLYETSRNPQSVKGIDWGNTLEGQNISFGNGLTTGTATTRASDGTTATTTTLPSGRTVTSLGSIPTVTETVLSSVLGSGGLSFDTARGFHPATAFLNADGMKVVLSFLNKDADTEVIALPRTVTLDNQPAVLSVTRAFPIFKTTPGTAQTPAGSEINYTNLGTILTVTPRISANSNIALKVVPEVSNIDSKDRQIQNGQIQEANVYAIRRIETQVVIPSGNTLVMGGLVSDSSTKSYTKVPLLGDLPGIGLAFRKDSKTRTKQNLLVFITPTIVRDSDFQPAESNFLQTRMRVPSERPEPPWDSGRPHDWTKPYTFK